MLMSRSRAKSTWTRTCDRGRVGFGCGAREGCAQIVEPWARLLPQPVAAGAACGVRLADRRAQVLLELEDAHLVHLDDAERLRVEPRRQRDPEAPHVPQLAVREPAAAAEEVAVDDRSTMLKTIAARSCGTRMCGCFGRNARAAEPDQREQLHHEAAAASPTTAAGHHVDRRAAIARLLLHVDVLVHVDEVLRAHLGRHGVRGARIGRAVGSSRRGASSRGANRATPEIVALRAHAPRCVASQRVAASTAAPPEAMGGSRQAEAVGFGTRPHLRRRRRSRRSSTARSQPRRWRRAPTRARARTTRTQDVVHLSESGGVRRRALRRRRRRQGGRRRVRRRGARLRRRQAEGVGRRRGDRRLLPGAAHRRVRREGRRRLESGASATVVVYDSNESAVLVGNAGDSKAVIGRGASGATGDGGPRWPAPMVLTSDHYEVPAARRGSRPPAAAARHRRCAARCAAAAARPSARARARAATPAARPPTAHRRALPRRRARRHARVEARAARSYSPPSATRSPPRSGHLRAGGDKVALEAGDRR